MSHQLSKSDKIKSHAVSLACLLPEIAADADQQQGRYGSSGNTKSEPKVQGHTCANCGWRQGLSSMTLQWLLPHVSGSLKYNRGFFHHIEFANSGSIFFWFFLIYAISVHWEKWCIMDRPSCMSNLWPHSVFHLDSLNACADNLSVVVLGAKWTCILALPQKMEGAAIARPFRTLTVEEHRSHYKCVLSVIYNWFLFMLPRTEQKSSAVPLTVTSAAWWGLWQTLEGYISVWWWLICPLYKPASTQRTWKWSPEWGTPTLQLPSVMFLSQSIFWL